MGVRLPLPAPDLNPSGSFGLRRWFAPRESATLAAATSFSVTKMQRMSSSTRRTFHREPETRRINTPLHASYSMSDSPCFHQVTF